MVWDEVEAAANKLRDDPVRNANCCTTLVRAIEDHAGDRGEWSGEAGREAAFAVKSLQRHFESPATSVSGLAGREDQVKAFADWRRAQIKAFRSAMRGLCASRACPAEFRRELLAAIIESLRLEPTKRFPVEHLSFVLEELCIRDALSDSFLRTLYTDYFGYADIVYHTLKLLARICATLEEDGRPAREQERTVLNVFDILKLLCKVVAERLSADEEEPPLWCTGEGENVGGDPASRPKSAGTKPLRHAFTEAWLAFARLQLPPEPLKHLLVLLPDSVLPHMTTPLLLSDSLTAAVDQPGMVGMLALRGLFVLVVKHGLEYPNFYRKLYNMITPQAFLSKYRRRFFRLVDTFLSSPLIPAYVVAAFIKKFARLSLELPPHSILVCLAFCFNLIRRHPPCHVLLKDQGREAGEGQVEGGREAFHSRADPYDFEANDPAEARALESFLWELQSLRVHYYHEVGKMVQHFKRDMTQVNKYMEVDLEDYLGSSYEEICEKEGGKRLKYCAIGLDPPTARDVLSNSFVHS